MEAQPIPDALDLEFSGELWYWGMIPVRAQIGATERTTSLFPNDGRYIVPVKATVRKAERLDDGDIVTVQLTTDGPPDGGG